MLTYTGLIYVYNRAESDDDGYNNWQLMAIDFKTGRKVFYIRPEFEKGEFKRQHLFSDEVFCIGNEKL